MRQALRLPFAPFERFLPAANRCRVLGTNTPTLRRAMAQGLQYDQAERWCRKLGVDPAAVWTDWPEPWEAVVQRFWLNVRKTEGCWEWIGDIDRQGYGVFYADGRCRRAHVFALEIVVGPAPAGTEACHSCDNPPCVRAPEHLRWGTRADNVRDAVERGRHARGETNGRSRLTAAHVVTLRNAYSQGKETVDLAAQFGVTDSTIQAVVAGRRWKHVGGPIVTRSVGRPPRGDHCRYGHSMADAYVDPTRHERTCRTCRRLSAMRSRERARQEGDP
jgi:HNH endonuclease